MLSVQAIDALTVYRIREYTRQRKTRTGEETDDLEELDDSDQEVAASAG